jgi:putative transposase
MFKGRQFDHSVMSLCVRWCLAYGLSLRSLKEMTAERGIAVDHVKTARSTASGTRWSSCTANIAI